MQAYFKRGFREDAEALRFYLSPASVAEASVDPRKRGRPRLECETYCEDTERGDNSDRRYRSHRGQLHRPGSNLSIDGYVASQRTVREYLHDEATTRSL